MKKKRSPKKKIGISLALLAALLLSGFLAVAGTPKKKPPLDTYAIVSGTVFQENGYSLPDAEVTIVPEVAAGDAPAKVQKMEAVSSERGEFTFRVPPGPMHYTVSVTAKGYQSQQKSIAVEGQERVEVTFQLERESK